MQYAIVTIVSKFDEIRWWVGGDNFNTFRFTSWKIPYHSPVFEAYTEECLRYIVPPDIESYKFLRFQWVKDKFDTPVF